MNECLISPRAKHAERRRAFTLIEILVVISIIGVLVALLLPAVQAARESARKVGCKNNLMQIGLAIHNYATAHEVLPPGVVESTRPIKSQPVGYHFSWIAQILPFIEQRNVHRKFDFSVSVYDPRNNELRCTELAVLSCPSNPFGGSTPNPGGTSYAGCHHDAEAPIDVDQNGVFFLNSSVRFKDISDGPANTIYVGEKLPFSNDLSWASGTRSSLRNFGVGINELDTDYFDPEDSDSVSWHAVDAERVDAMHVGSFGSIHAGGAHFAFGDGSVRFIHQNVNSKVLTLLGNRADGQMIGDF